MSGRGFTSIPDGQKTFCGNLATTLTKDEMTQWLESKGFEVPIPLRVVQQLIDDG